MKFAKAELEILAQGKSLNEIETNKESLKWHN